MLRTTQIALKTAEEQQKLRVAGALAADVLDMIGEHVAPGISTDELDRICHDYIVNVQQAIPANVGYRGFPKTVCTSVNHVVCHGIPNERRLKSGDILNIDVAVIKDGYHGDTSRMYFVGKPPVLGQRLAEVCKDAMWRAIELVRPGAHLGDIGHAIQSLAEEQGFSVVREYCGHGIGRVYHEDPQILHYGEPDIGSRDTRRHGVHDRTDDQRGQASRARAARRLDRGHQGSLAVGAVGAHGAGDADRARSADLEPSSRPLTPPLLTHVPWP